MKLIIIMSNEAGELERREAEDGEDAVNVLTDMVEGCPYLNDGDTFQVKRLDKSVKIG